MVPALFRRFSRLRGGSGDESSPLKGASAASVAVVRDARGEACACHEAAAAAAPIRVSDKSAPSPAAKTASELTCFVLQESLKEKELLIREIHHRVKNNLQVISSLLNLQGRASTSPDAQRACEESQLRIRSIALIHELLYQSENMSRISAAEYLERLGTKLLSAFGLGGRVKLAVHRTPVTIDLDHAVPFGLVVNELFTNSMKHAFPNGRTGTVSVGVKAQDDGKAVLEFSDDGVGLPSSIDPLTSESLGFRLVASLTRQLDGSLECDRTKGVGYRITFPIPEMSGE